jgi:hypothetical protein
MIRKTTAKGTVVDRQVTGRDGNDIYYSTSRTGPAKIRNCWISTWMEWGRNSDVVTTAT